MFKAWTIWLWENFNFLGTQAHTIPLRNCWAWEWTRCLASVRFDLWELVDTVYSIYFVLHGSHQKQIKDMFRFFFSLLYFKLTIFYGEVEYTTYFWVHDDMIRLMMTMTMTTTTMTTKMVILMLINMIIWWWGGGGRKVHGLMRFGMAVPIGFSCQRINTVDCVGVTVAQKLDAATLVADEYTVSH